MSDEKNNIIYTADDIKRYITGAMSPAEMHAIEMAALDDPLLAEAMEGYDLMEQKDWSKELGALKQQFIKNEKEQALVIPIGNKATTFKWWKAAAAVIVLGATATTAYIFTKKNNNEVAVTQNIASLEKRVSDSTGFVTTDSVNAFANINPAADSNTPLIAKVEKVNDAGAAITTTQGTVSADAYSPAVQERETNTSKPAAATYDDVAVNDRKDAARAKEYKADEVASGNAANNADVAVNENEFKYKAEESIVITDKAKASNNGAYYNNTANSFSGLVVTPDNKPVSYANINIPQAKKPVFTDANGRFTITAPDTTVNVTVSSAGYSAQKFILKNNSGFQNKIVMQPQEVATQTIGKKREAVKKQQAIADSIAMEEEAEPAGGWVEYNNYLHDNLKSPTDARQSNVHGEVEVTVKLKNNGEISTVKVAKPLCPECDAEAVRLVKDGPKWDVKNNKKNKVKVKVKF